MLPAVMLGAVYAPTALAVCAVVAGGLIALVLSRFVFRPVDDSLLAIEVASHGGGDGDSGRRRYHSSPFQISELSAAVNSLQRRLESLIRASSEQDAILRTMVEGVVTVDAEGRIRRINTAAKRLLDMDPAVSEGKLIGAMVRQPELGRFIHEAISSRDTRSATLRLLGSRETVIEVNASPMIEEQLAMPGTLFVIHDVTRVKRLESVRREFVANVSHELRTPITSIKGFVETLVDGASEDPELSRKFLGIIGRQAERLNMILNDLLTLAKLEAGEDGAQVETERKNVRDLVRVALEDCARRAEEKAMQLRVDVADDLFIYANSSLVEQALVNLVDNAIKYSESGGSVWVEARTEGALVEIRVVDNGPGIERSHLARLFERFYRIDQGRSRQLGGTGLGLAIVKHIAQVHGGRVAVTSVEGEGSTFSIFLRRA
jgi:two-component system phosphate regulon sensor histidine kinase PhoR